MGPAELEELKRLRSIVADADQFLSDYLASAEFPDEGHYYSRLVDVIERIEAETHR